MIAIPLTTKRSHWNTISFASTLYLRPILDLLLAKIPSELQPELRLGLQEALVNAAKHGNKLDPDKSVVVEYSVTNEEYSWIISDEGSGFVPTVNYNNIDEEDWPLEEAENGRGLCILYQIFDQVDWDSKGTKLRLCKQIKTSKEEQAIAVNLLPKVFKRSMVWLFCLLPFVGALGLMPEDNKTEPWGYEYTPTFAFVSDFHG